MAVKSKRDIRNFMPKFGTIRDRKHQLHEVIRLTKGNTIEIGEEVFVITVKVGSVSSYRIQTYFIDNDDFYTYHGLFDESGKIQSHTHRKIIFNAKSIFETASRLSWIPNIIHCNGWLSALLPAYLKFVYRDHPVFKDTKIVVSLINDDFSDELNKQMFGLLLKDGIPEERLNQIEKLNYNDLMKLSIDFADGITILGSIVNSELLDYALQSGKPFVAYDENFSENTNALYNQLLREE
jgi:starch synthase